MWQSITYWASLNNLLQGQVHPSIASDQMSVQGLAILELYEHWVPLGGGKKA